MDINLEKRGFYRGVNLGGWFSQCDYCKEHMDTFITEDDFSRIASWGLDHVRIPVDYNVLEHQDGSIRRSGYVRIDKAVSLCEKYGLHLVLDLHKTAGFSFDDYGESEYGFFESPQYQERFYHLWEEIARHYGRKPESIAFELLNEVTDKAYHTTWNAIVRRCITRIRAIAPATLILVGGYHNNSAEAVKDLAPPFDKHVVYNMHCYEPLRFTH